jgi:hypothetical protein
MTWNKIWLHKVTHENVHEKLDSVEIEGYKYHLSDPSHKTKVCRVRTAPITIDQRPL